GGGPPNGSAARRATTARSDRRPPTAAGLVGPGRARARAVPDARPPVALRAVPECVDRAPRESTLGRRSTRSPAARPAHRAALAGWGGSYIRCWESADDWRRGSDSIAGDPRASGDSRDEWRGYSLRTRGGPAARTAPWSAAERTAGWPRGAGPPTRTAPPRPAPGRPPRSTPRAGVRGGRSGGTCGGRLSVRAGSSARAPRSAPVSRTRRARSTPDSA